MNILLTAFIAQIYSRFSVTTLNFSTLRLKNSLADEDRKAVVGTPVRSSGSFYTKL